MHFACLLVRKGVFGFIQAKLHQLEYQHYSYYFSPKFSAQINNQKIHYNSYDMCLYSLRFY